MSKLVSALTLSTLGPVRPLRRGPGLLRDVRGSEFIEKLVVISLFVFVGVIGLAYLGGAVKTKFESQGRSIEAAEDQLPSPGGQGGPGAGSGVGGI